MATIYDVAKAAGVTAATVSVALSGRGVVNRKTREHILRCAKELGYRPNLVARSLTTGQTHTIALVVYDITNPFYGEVALAVEQTALRSGYRVTFANTMGDKSLGAELLDNLAARQVDGIIVMAGGLSVDARARRRRYRRPDRALHVGRGGGPWPRYQRRHRFCLGGSPRSRLFGRPRPSTHRHRRHVCA